MIDLHAELVSALDSVLPCYYEMALTQDTKTPCISYMETNNYTIQDSYNATFGYSRITYQVKIWGNDIATIQSYVPKVDAVLRALNFKRIASGELYDNTSTMIQKILTYEVITQEKYIGGTE